MQLPHPSQLPQPLFLSPHSRLAHKPLPKPPKPRSCLNLRSCLSGRPLSLSPRSCLGRKPLNISPRSCPSGKPIFLSGTGGTGKSYCMKGLVEQLQAKDVHVSIIAE